MKRLSRILLMALMAVATVGFVACKKENTGTTANTDNPGDTGSLTYETLERTEWEGSYATTTQTPQGNMPVTLRWTIDFMADGKASVMLVLDSQAFYDTPIEWESEYTYDPATGNGVMSDENLDSVTFTTDAVNRTITAELVIKTQHEEDGPVYSYGGVTTLHQTL